MAKVVMNWELGEGYGHLLRLLPLAIELNHRGHEVVFILRNLERVESLFGEYRFQIYQAPVWQAIAKGMPEIVSYTDILLRFGYFDASGLTGLVRSWRNYFRLLQPDLLVFDHSPTALLAAREESIPRVILANGFEVPPNRVPLPAIRWWEKTAQAKLIDHEQKVLSTIHQVQQNLSQSPLKSLAELFDVERTFLATFAEIDQYPNRQNGNYTGIVMGEDIGVKPNWPLALGKKVFVYLNVSYAGFGRVLSNLDALDCCVLVHAPGLSEAKIRHLESANIKFSSAAVNIEEVRHQCDLAICHSGIGTGTALLLAGCPLLLLPNHLEQYTAAKRIVELGAGLLVVPEQKKVDFKPLLKSLLKDKKYSDAAKAFASKNSDFNAKKTVQDLADQCEGLMGQQARTNHTAIN